VRKRGEESKDQMVRLQVFLYLAIGWGIDFVLSQQKTPIYQRTSYNTCYFTSKFNDE
jgi:hypothetical protein